MASVGPIMHAPKLWATYDLASIAHIILNYTLYVMNEMRVCVLRALKTVVCRWLLFGMVIGEFCSQIGVL